MSSYTMWATLLKDLCRFFYVSLLVILRVFSTQCSSSGEVETQAARFISTINTFILSPGDG